MTIEMDYAKTPSNSRLDVINAVVSVLPDTPGVAVLHSSLYEFKTYESNVENHFLSALTSLVDKGWTIMLPAFTFSFCEGAPFVRSEPTSETGVLAGLAYTIFQNTKRTTHPIYSFVVAGPQTDKIMALNAKTAFGDDSVFAWLEKTDATLVMIGCGWKYCTQFHRYEQIADVEYRQHKLFTGLADYGNGLTDVECSMFVRDLEVGPINDFSQVIEKLNNENEIKKATIFDGLIQSTKVSSLSACCLEILKQDRFAFLSNRTEVQKKIRDKAERLGQPTTSVMIFGQKNVEILRTAVQSTLGEIIPERRFNCLSLPYGQMYQNLYVEDDQTYASSAGVKIFSDRLEDLPGFNPSDQSQTIASVEEYAELIKKLHIKVGGWSIINLFANTERPLSSNQSLEVNQLYAKANEKIKAVIADLSQIAWVDLSSEISAYQGPIADNRLKFIGKFPWSNGFSEHLAHSWVGLIVSMLGKDSRVMIVDLDNTLWGGVLGEDGIAGLSIGGDYPGNTFKAFQDAVLEHAGRGVALAIASKNDEDLALSAIKTLSDMSIREDDIHCYAINWEPKWRNIIKICDQLNIGLSSALFIDDNPVERETVRRNLPDVKVLELPVDPADYTLALKSCPFLRPVSITNEDLGRLNDFNANKDREKIKTSAENLLDYYQALQIDLHLVPLCDSNAQRAAQLCQKTNQFNSTTRRYDQKQLFDMTSSGDDVFVINYADKFSPAENIGVIIIRYAEREAAFLDLYLLSCRVLGRGIENIVPNIAAKIADQKGYEKISAEVIRTTRNTPVRDIYQSSGFCQMSETIWEMKCANFVIPNWLDYQVKTVE